MNSHNLSLCSSCPALAAEIAHGHLCDAQAERITASEAEIERLKLQVEVLDRSTREYENDCAILPEDRSVTEYVRMLYRRFIDICVLCGNAEPTPDENGDSREWMAVDWAGAAVRHLKERAASLEQQIISREDREKALQLMSQSCIPFYEGAGEDEKEARRLLQLEDHS